MKGLLRPLPTIFACAVLAMSAVSACAQYQALGPQRAVLLLRNGEIIEGVVTFSGDRYDVTLGDGEIRIKSSEVEFQGESIDDCFEFRCRNLDGNKADDFLNLSEWCLRHQLYAESAGQLREAMRLDPMHPRIGVIERRLKLSIAEQPAGELATAAAAAASGPTIEELDRMIRGLSPRTVEMFTNTIQPLLLNNCSTAGCHGPQSSGQLHLLRIPPGRVTSRRSTQRNLHSVLGVIDRGQPSESALLLVPVKPHGGMKGPVFTNRELSQYRQLLDWVMSTGASHQPSRPATLEEPASPLLQTVATPPAAAATPPASPLPATVEIPTANGPETINLDQPIDGAVPPRTPPKRGELPQGFIPKDAFDPEIFNRRYFGK